MAITTMDGLVAAIASGQRLVMQKASITAVAPNYYSLWTAGGQPAAGGAHPIATSSAVVAPEGCGVAAEVGAPTALATKTAPPDHRALAVALLMLMEDAA